MKKIAFVVLFVLIAVCFTSCTTAKTGTKRLISEINSEKKGMAQKDLRTLKNEIKSGSYSVVYGADNSTYRIASRGFTFDEGCRVFMAVTVSPDEKIVRPDIVVTYKDKTPLNISLGVLNIDGAETDLGAPEFVDGPEQYTGMYTEKLTYEIDNEMFKNLINAFDSYRTVNIRLIGDERTAGGTLSLEAAKTFKGLLGVCRMLKRYYN